MGSGMLEFGEGAQSKQVLFGFVLQWVKHLSATLGLCTLVPSPLHSVTGCEVAYPGSEMEPHTAGISYT